MSKDKNGNIAFPGQGLTFDRLIGAIGEVHQRMAARAGRAVNVSLTVRNWLIGFYIEEYERHGVDRAEYGEKLADKLAAELTGRGLSNCNRRELYRYRQFYLVYPQIMGTVSPQLPETELNLLEKLSFSHFLELLKRGGRAPAHLL